MREGLRRVLEDVPVRGGYLEAIAGLSVREGPYARAEAGLRPLENLSVFGFGMASPIDQGVGVGVRWEF